MTEMIHAFGDISLLCLGMMFHDDIVPPTTAAATALATAAARNRCIARSNQRITIPEPGLGVTILFPSLPSPEKGGLCYSISIAPSF